MAPDPRNADLVARARLRTAVAVLVTVTVVLVAALVAVALQKANAPLVANPDDRPAFTYRTDDMPISAVLRVHGHSAPVVTR